MTHQSTDRLRPLLPRTSPSGPAVAGETQARHRKKVKTACESCRIGKTKVGLSTAYNIAYHSLPLIVLWGATKMYDLCPARTKLPLCGFLIGN